jgi:hypothetical protein
MTHSKFGKDQLVPTATCSGMDFLQLLRHNPGGLFDRKDLTKVTTGTDGSFDRNDTAKDKTCEETGKSNVMAAERTATRNTITDPAISVNGVWTRLSMRQDTVMSRASGWPSEWHAMPRERTLTGGKNEGSRTRTVTS